MPTYVTCAEPSPDVAKAFSKAFDSSLAGSATLPSGVSPELAAAVSIKHAEALAQLGERLATIQLLRDGLYRACEAYANGALTDASYAVLLSGADDAMVTMLMGEIAGGAFGRSLAALGTGAEGKAAASLDLEQTESQSRQAERNFENAVMQKESAGKILDAAAASGDPGVVQEAQTSFKQAEKAAEEAQSALKEAYKAAAEGLARALFVTAGGGITASPQPEIAQILHTMQRKYIENINFDAVEIACMMALDRPSDEATELTRMCGSTLLPGIGEKKARLLELILERSEREKDEVAKHYDAQRAFSYVKTYLQELKGVNSIH